MALTAASGCISKAEEVLRVTLADSTTFRTWVGASGQGEALESIYIDALPPPGGDAAEYTLAELQALRPYAIVWTDDETGLRVEHDATGDSGFESMVGGELQVRLVQDVPADVADNPSEIGRRFRNTVGDIIDDVRDLAGGAGYLAITGISARGPFRSHEDLDSEQGDYVEYFLALEY